MKSKLISLTMMMVMAVACSGGTNPTKAWRLVTKSASGPLVQIDLPDAKGKRRTVFVAVEYARACDPIFSYTEIAGKVLGAPTSQSVLHDSKIGVLLNGTFYTWGAAQTKYVNGHESAFGIQDELLLKLLSHVESLAYVTPLGEPIPLPTSNFSQALQSAIDLCRTRVK